MVELDYDELTLDQRRARLQSLSVADLDALLAYEEATKGRAPFQTLLANRITRASARLARRAPLTRANTAGGVPFGA